MKSTIQIKPFLTPSILFLLLFWSSANCIAQTIPRIRITGKVKDASNNQPLYFVQVYLANTSMGCTTEEDGTFTIERVPLGNYQLIVSLIGHERMERDIQLKEIRDQTFEFKLKPTTLQGQKITVTAPNPREWQKNLEKFKKHFIGTSAFAEFCQILNPEVLDLEYDKNSGILSAKTDIPLQIENRALGYTISYTLKNYMLQDKMFRFSGYTYFQETVAVSDVEKFWWKQNREKAYYGSVNHFLTSLIQNRLKEEEYIIHQASELPLTVRTVRLNAIQPDTLVTQGMTPYERKITFPRFIRVVYTRDWEEDDYIKEMGRKLKKIKQKETGQVSWLEVGQPVIYANLQGHIDNPYALTFFGYWAWREKIANLLPLDYLPDSERKESSDNSTK
jgi:hypothetical protein